VFAYLEDVDERNGAPRATYVTEGEMRAAFVPRAGLLGGELGLWREPSFTRADLKPWAAGESRAVRIAMQPVAYTFARGHRVRISLAGADVDNFLQLPDLAPRWTIALAGASTLTLPRWDDAPNV